MSNCHRSQNFRQFSNLFSQIRLKKRHTSLFSGICREIRTKFHRNFSEKMKKIGNSIFIREKMLTIFGWNFEIWAVQKYVGSFLPKTHKCKSCRSRQELSNEYLLAKIGVDTAENEPLEVWGENSIQYSLHSLLAAQLRRSAGCRAPAWCTARCSVLRRGFWARVVPSVCSTSRVRSAVGLVWKFLLTVVGKKKISWLHTAAQRAVQLLSV